MPLANAASFPFGINVLIFVIAAAIIWIVGGKLTRALDAIAERTGLGHAFVGMLLLGGITSLPELANVVTASAIGNPALAVNNLLGSSAINIVLLAVADALIGRRAVTSIVAQPSTMMMAALCMIILVLIAALVVLGDMPAGPVGIGSVIVGGASVGFFWLSAGHDDRSAWRLKEDAAIEREDPDADDAGAALGALWFRVTLHAALMFCAGYALSQTGDAIADQAGLTSAIVGFALIGAATSLPELVTVIAALKLKRPEMAFGQILGTNFVNLAMLPIGDLVFQGKPVIGLLGRFEILSALLGAILIGIFMVGLLEHRDRTIFRMGLDSATIIMVFAIGTGLLAWLPA